MNDPFSLARIIAMYIANGALALLYMAGERAPALAILAASLGFLRGAPPPQRAWMVGAGLLALLAGFLTPPPAPALLAGMALAGLAAVSLDRFHPDALRWRVVGGLTLYAGAALAYLAYSRYLDGVDAASWAQTLGGQDAAQSTLAQGRAFLNTLATWGLWLILPLGFLSLLAQGLLAHPPTGERPGETIARVRTREEA